MARWASIDPAEAFVVPREEKKMLGKGDTARDEGHFDVSASDRAVIFADDAEGARREREVIDEIAECDDRVSRI